MPVLAVSAVRLGAKGRAMENPLEPPRRRQSVATATGRPYQYSLWSLLVFSTVVSVLCSIGVCTNWRVPATFVVGVGISFVGFHWLSLRKHPTAGVAFSVAGFLVRLTGLAIIAYGLNLLFAQVALRLGQRGFF